MSRTELALKRIPTAGLLNPTGTASAADGHKFQNDGKVVVRVANASGFSKTLTFVTARTLGGYALEDQDVAVADGVTKWVGPFSPALFNRKDGSADASMVYLDYSLDDPALVVTVFHLG